MNGSETFYVYELAFRVQLVVWFKSSFGSIEDFVVKLIYQGQEIIRYDSGHGCPHQDILYLGKKKWLNIDNNEALTLAIEDFRLNYSKYIERYKSWQQKLKKSKDC